MRLNFYGMWLCGKQVVTKDILGDIRSPVEHVNAYFEHHAMFEVSNQFSTKLVQD